MTVTVVATVEASNSPPRVRLDVTSIGGANTSVTVTRLNPDGRTVPVRTQDGNPLSLTTSGLNTVGLIYDYEMQYGAVVQFSTMEDPTSSSGDVTVPVSQVWLVHPGVPALSMPITITDMSARTMAVQRGVFTPMGRAAPVVVTEGVRRTAEYDLSLITLSDTERVSLISIISDAGPLLLNAPDGWSIGAEYIAVADVAEQRVTNIPTEPTRTWALKVTVIDRPAGGSTSQRTYVDLLTYPTYLALLAAYPSYQDLLAGP